MARERTVRQREGNEIEFSRIVAFSDGVFAIAITLLVLSLEIPEHLHHESFGEAFWDQRRDLIAYALSFAVIGRFWVVHHRFFGEVTGFDSRLLGLNIFCLAWIVLASIPLALLTPDLAPYLWLALFLDPSRRLGERLASRVER